MRSNQGLILREIEFLGQMRDLYRLKAEGAAKAFEEIAALAMDTDNFSDMVTHMGVLCTHCHLDDQDPDFWLGEREFYELAHKLFNNINESIIKERRIKNGE